jgi:hypothetical protein
MGESRDFIDTIHELRAENKALRLQVRSLEEEVLRLRAELKTRSHNRYFKDEIAARKT